MDSSPKLTRKKNTENINGEIEAAADSMSKMSPFKFWMHLGYKLYFFFAGESTY